VSVLFEEHQVVATRMDDHCLVRCAEVCEHSDIVVQIDHVLTGAVQDERGTFIFETKGSPGLLRTLSG
jgi:hypothetical protein